jgi:hypothetical protein
MKKRFSLTAVLPRLSFPGERRISYDSGQPGERGINPMKVNFGQVATFAIAGVVTAIVIKQLEKQGLV